ncbi:MAG TPA: hypothetical protein VK890_06430 [Bacteroidia bacterium]|jgi:hypothetical protein|nr:hypothetical protein [Bacteroidia bacterium]
MNYSKTQIMLLCDALQGETGAAKKLLAESKELFAFESAVRGDVKAAEWLIKEHKELALFVAAIFGNKSAIKVLLKKQEFVLAATVNYFKGDDKAGVWLEIHNMKHFAQLAESIKYAQKKREIE